MTLSLLHPRSPLLLTQFVTRNVYFQRQLLVQIQVVPFTIKKSTSVDSSPNFFARSLSAEISEKVQPPRNITSTHLDAG